MKVTIPALALAFAICGLGQARAAVIFSNFGPGDSFDDAGNGLGTPNNSNNSGVRFTVESSDYPFISADVALQYFGGTNAVTFGIRTDSNGPGDLLQSFTATNIPATSPGLSYRFLALLLFYCLAGC
jgi:hypothetical protein